jgi:hypothetical protein
MQHCVNGWTLPCCCNKPQRGTEKLERVLTCSSEPDDTINFGRSQQNATSGCCTPTPAANIDKTINLSSAAHEPASLSGTGLIAPFAEFDVVGLERATRAAAAAAAAASSFAVQRTPTAYLDDNTIETPQLGMP